jgi:hypothetical protein
VILKVRDLRGQAAVIHLEYPEEIHPRKDLKRKICQKSNQIRLEETVMLTPMKIDVQESVTKEGKGQTEKKKDTVEERTETNENPEEKDLKERTEKSKQEKNSAVN